MLRSGDGVNWVGGDGLDGWNFVKGSKQVEMTGRQGKSGADR